MKHQRYLKTRMLHVPSTAFLRDWVNVVTVNQVISQS